MAGDHTAPLRTVGQPLFDERARSRDALAWWQTALVIALSIIVALAVVRSVGVLFRPLILLVLAIVIAAAVEPVVKWLAQRMARAWASTLVYSLIVLAVIALAWIAIPRIAEQGLQLGNRLPTMMGQSRQWINRWDPTPGNRALNVLLGSVGNLAADLAALPVTIASLTIDIVVVFFLAVYWTIFAPGVRRFVLSLFPTRLRSEANGVIAEMGEVTGGYVRAVLIDAVIVGIITYVGLLLIGVNFALVLAIIAGIGEIVPIVGPIIAGVIATGFALLQSPTKALIVLVFFLVLQQIESNLLVPNIVHRTASIPPPLALWAFVAGAALGGPLVAITAIPLFGALYILTLRVIAPAVRRWSGAAGDPPAGEPPSAAQRAGDGQRVVQPHRAG